MKRLTIRNSDGSVSQPTDLNWAAALEKLAAYEDTWLEPEEVLTALEMADLFATLRKLNEYQEAEAEGRLLILPCKVGDVLYEVDLPEYGVIICEVLEAICINKHDGGRKDAPVVECGAVTVEVIEGHGAGSCYSFDLQDFGKTVFLTRDEAEAALKERSQ